MRHVVITRLGIGCARRSFFQRHIGLLRLGAFRSMQNQTSRNFEWVICTDCMIDAGSRAELEEMVSSAPNYRAVYLSPPETGTMVPRASDVLNPSEYDGITITSRIDDDDAIHPDFIARVQDLVATSPQQWPMALNFPIGLEVHPTSGRFTTYRRPEIAIGLSLAEVGTLERTVFNYRHTKIFELVAEEDGTAVIADEPAPMWVHHRVDDSDSNIHQEEIRLHAKARTDLPELTDHLCHLGLGERWMDEVKEFLERTKDDAPPLVTPSKLARIVIKSNILKTIRTQFKKGSDPVEREALIAAFYAV